MQKKKIYTQDFKAQIIKEVQDVGSLSAVAKTHQISLASLHRWTTGKSQVKPLSTTTSSIIDLKKKLADADLEIRVLKELLKKTNQAWLKD